MSDLMNYIFLFGNAFYLEYADNYEVVNYVPTNWLSDLFGAFSHIFIETSQVSSEFIFAFSFFFFFSSACSIPLILIRHAFKRCWINTIQAFSSICLLSHQHMYFLYIAVFPGYSTASTQLIFYWLLPSCSLRSRISHFHAFCLSHYIFTFFSEVF